MRKICVALCLIISTTSFVEASMRTSLLRARIFIERGQWSAAEAELEPLAKTWPNDADVMSQLALVYRQSGRIAEAEKILVELVRRNPRDVDARGDLGMLYSEIGRDTEAVTLIKPLVSNMATAQPYLLLALANSYERLGLGDRAEKIYESLASRRVNDVSTLIMIADHHAAHDRRSSAADFYRRALAGEPKNYDALKGLGAALAEAAPDESRRLLLEALPLNDRDHEVPYQLGEVYRTVATDSAQAYYREALRRLDRDSAGYSAELARGRILHRLHRSDEARAQYQKLLERYPADAVLRNDYAEMLIDERRYDEALALLSS